MSVKPVYPVDFIEAARVLVGALRGGETTNEVFHAAWVVAGYSLGQFFPCDCETEFTFSKSAKEAPVLSEFDLADKLEAVLAKCDPCDPDDPDCDPDCDPEDPASKPKVKFDFPTLPWDIILRSILYWILRELET